MMKLALESVPELKKLIDLPPDCHYFPMLFGYPAVQYPRTVQRDDVAQVKRLSETGTLRS